MAAAGHEAVDGVRGRMICPLCDRSPSCSWRPGESPIVRGRGFAVSTGRPGALQSQARQGQQRDPGELCLEQRQGRHRRNRGAHSSSWGLRQEGGAVGGLPGPGYPGCRGAHGTAHPPGAPAPGQEESWQPRNPHPPPTRTPASSRPGSPCNR